MPSLLSIRPGSAPWLCRALPHAYEESARVQFLAMPGVSWVADTAAPNGRGYYEGPTEAIAIVVRTLEAARVIKVHGSASLTPHHYSLANRAGLRDYQVAGAEWIASMLSSTGGALLADEMGLGKTAQTIRALEALAHSVIVVCPAIVAPHWRSQITQWSSDSSVQWSVYSYEKLQKALRKDELPAAQALVIDEAHYVANPRSKRSQAIRVACERQGSRRLILGLSGTPMTARPRDLWHPLDLLWPGRFGSKWSFERRYCDGHYEEIPGLEKSVWVADGATRVDELGERLRACMLRRTKADVALELPPISRTLLEVEIPLAARRALAKAAAALDLNGAALARVGVSTLLSNVEQYKLEAAAELAREALAAGERVLLFTTRKASAEQLSAMLGDAPFATGDDPAPTRRAKIAEAQCAIATMQSMTTGIDLVGFSAVIFVGLDWVPSTVQQAEARVWRLGQTRNVTAYYLVGRGTLDEVVRERVLERLDVFTAAIGGGSESFRSGLAGASEDDLINELVARIKKG